MAKIKDNRPKYLIDAEKRFDKVRELRNKAKNRYHDKVIVPGMKKNIGQCFCTKPDGLERIHYLYIINVHVTEDNYYLYDVVQITQGKQTDDCCIERVPLHDYVFDDNSYTKIGKTDFEKVYNAAMKSIELK